MGAACAAGWLASPTFASADGAAQSATTAAVAATCERGQRDLLCQSPIDLNRPVGEVLASGAHAIVFGLRRQSRAHKLEHRQRSCDGLERIADDERLTAKPPERARIE